MNTLAGYITTGCATFAAGYLLRRLEPKTKIVFWQPHDFLYTIPPTGPLALPAPAVPPVRASAVAPAPAPAPFYIRTQSVIIQNLGRKPAEWVEIVHARKPDFFQLYPSLNYTEQVTPTGEHVIRVDSLAPNEFFTIQFLSYLHAPQLLYIRSAAGHASPIPVIPVRQYPKFVLLIWNGLALTGVGFIAYWVIKAAFSLLKATGAF